MEWFHWRDWFNLLQLMDKLFAKFQNTDLSFAAWPPGWVVDPAWCHLLRICIFIKLGLLNQRCFCVRSICTQLCVCPVVWRIKTTAFLLNLLLHKIKHIQDPIIKTLWIWNRNRMTDEWNRIVIPVIIHPHTSGQLNFNKDAMAIQ